MIRLLRWLYRRDVTELARDIRRDVHWFLVGDVVVAVTAKQARELEPWLTRRQIAWQNALDGRVLSE